MLVTVLKAKALDMDTGDLRIVLIPKNIASASGLRGGSRVRVTSNSKFVTAWV